MHSFVSLTPQAVLDSISDGVYVTDLSRKIVYWNKSAEQITGWPASEIVGKHCYDDVLCHVDKDDHRLCGEEYCPLHRSIVTGQASTVPFIVFAKKQSGGRVPLQVSVAPVKNAGDEVVGGVETFRDLSREIRDIERAKTIQSLSLQEDLPADERVRFSRLYIPRDVIGGDFGIVAQIDADRYGIFLADITGHGVPAALYTMYLSSLWKNAHQMIVEPVKFAQYINEQLCQLTQAGDSSFAAGVCGLLDVSRGTLRLVGAGNPDPMLIHKDGRWQHLDAKGLPLGVMSDQDYEETVVKVGSGDCVLFYTDGAIEITEQDGNMLGMEGLEKILKTLGYPDVEIDLGTIEKELLARSDRIRLDDDLTFLEVRMA